MRIYILCFDGNFKAACNSYRTASRAMNNLIRDYETITGDLLDEKRFTISEDRVMFDLDTRTNAPINPR